MGKSKTLSNFAKTLILKSEDGLEIYVPVSEQHNRMLNCVLVSQARTLVQEQLKMIRDLKQTIQPKELKDLVSSVRDLVEASGEVYQKLGGEIEPSGETKKAEKADDPIDVDFTKMEGQTSATPKQPEKPTSITSNEGPEELQDSARVAGDSGGED